ncbi:DNA-directed RNA polymerase V subunit 1 [Cornus florida]|uniref:DNA-directed RNA polymerase V subunit 1 n=1 Tax=Cornus florida TaxID=4283 RepID=UPI00289F4506|nr:DNA-directed RNA polymerase V subunit 1 [Cornus florida]
MEENPSCTLSDGLLTGIRFGLATPIEICTSSNSDLPISHASQLSNPFLGLPLESGKCESCGTAEPGQCEGHFGYIELPIPIYHPSHIGELKRMLSMLCLKCLKIKNRKVKNIGLLERALSSCCEEASQISINEVKANDGAFYLELKLPTRSRLQDGFWNFLERYGFRYGDDHRRPLLPYEVMAILKKIPEETRKKLAGKGYFPQHGYIVQYLPVPPNCLSVPDVSDGISVMSSDLSTMMLKKVLKQVEIIKNSRSGTPNFESHEVEANDLQAAVAQYLQVRGTAKASRDLDGRFGINKEPNDSSTKAWLEKMKTLFIRKGSGFSSRSVITGDPYKRVDEIGLPFEIAQRITFEERVNQHNMKYLQKLVDENLCLTYKDGSSTYSLREGSKGHTFLRSGQVVHRRIMDGDMVFVNRPPTTHKHSLQALSVYVHEDHTVKINPLICGPLSADFDGDCVHLFYPQSLAAKAEVLELFSVEKQLLSSHSGNLNLQLATDSLLSLKMMFMNYFLNRAAAQQLAMFVLNSLPKPALLKAYGSGPLWTALQMLQTALPACFDCCGERHLIRKSEILKVDFNRDVMQSIINDIVTSIFSEKGPDEVLRFFNSLQPLLMENIFSEGFSVCLEDFSIPRGIIEDIQKNIQGISPLLYHLRSTSNEGIELQLENQLRLFKLPIANFILKSSAMGNLIDSRSDSAVNKVVQQIGILGLQLSSKGKFYSGTLLEDMTLAFDRKYPFGVHYQSEKFGLVRSCLFHGLDPYQEMVHSISSREVIVRSSKGLSEPGTLFKNLMAILRDVVICYDGTVRNACSNSIIQFEYGVKAGTGPRNFFPAGEPVGVLAATAMSNPAYKAVLESSPSSNCSWEMMKEILLCRVNFKNDVFDRRVILYLNECGCGRKYCQENAAYLVKNQLKKVSLKDTAVELLIEYRGQQQTVYDSSEIDHGLVGHIHLNKMQLKDANISMSEVLQKCQETVNSFRKKKKVGHLFKRILLSVSECCSFQQHHDSKWVDMPCMKFFWQDTGDQHLEAISHILANTVCPVLLETIIKGDPRVCTANIIWISPDTSTWIQKDCCKSHKGELALDIVLEKAAVKTSGDAWRIVMDSCLPVFHLIDTCRSIPYAIKQVQDLLGVACAFEQAVQRLSTSVSMVAKGILKDHLILLANSMTCAGNLIGFNAGGIKALSRSLNVQIPFTEATLFTPKKCFERAAEKCHVDSLSSIVASCSWGKHVAVGTGNSFDVLWDTREVGLNQQDESDVYNFLNLVRSSTNEELNSACLGGEIDNFELEYENMESGFSPDHNSSFDKPIFEDNPSFEDNSAGWGTVDSGETLNQSGQSAAWGKKIAAEETGWNKKNGQPENSTGWAAVNSGEKLSEDNSTGWGAVGSVEKLNQSGPSAAWGKKVSAEETGWNKKNGQPENSTGWAAVNSGEKLSEDNSTGWGAVGSVEKLNQSGPSAAWGKKIAADETGWNKKNGQPENSTGWAAVNSGEKLSEDNSTGWGAVGSVEKLSQSGPSAAWGKKIAADETGWNKKNGQTDNSTGWGTIESGKKRSEDNSTGWGAIDSGKKLIQTGPSAPWGKKIAADETNWNKKNDIPLVDHSADQISSAAGVPTEDQPQTLDTLSKTSVARDSSNDEGWGKVGLQSDTGWHKESPVNLWGSSQNATEEPSYQSSSTGCWGSSKVSGSNERDVQSQWGTQKRNAFKRDPTENSRNWGSSSGGDWKNKRKGPAKSVGGLNDDSIASGTLTATRQRLDMFTSEEQDVLLDVEPIMLSIRRIMHQPGYNDGDPLPPDDQSYILDNVFSYHPDKAVKMGAGIDYVMVNKHSSFQDSRCLYIVSTDGHKEDFSYRKCLENFISGKYPDKAESFNSKYFRRPRPAPGWNKERSPAPGWNGERSPAPGGWGGERSPASGGWGGERSPAPGGWSGDRSPAPEEAGPGNGQ